MSSDPTGAILDLGRALIARFLDAQARARPAPSPFAVTAAEVQLTLGTRGVVDRRGSEASEAGVVAASVAVITLANAGARGLGALRSRLGLDDTELLIVAALLAPELDPELERAFAFALDDFTRKRPDAGFLVRLLTGGDRDAESAVLARIGEGSRLHRDQLVIVTGDGPFATRTIRVADRLALLVRGVDVLDGALHGLAVLAPAVARDALVMNAEILATLGRALDRPHARIVLSGRTGTGRGVSVVMLATERGVPVLRVDLERIVLRGELATIGVTIREAALRGAILVYDGGESGDVLAPALRIIANATADLALPIVITTTARPAWLAQLFDDLVEIDVPPPTLSERIELWRRALPADVAPCAEHLELIAARYTFTGAAIVRAARRAVNAASVRAPNERVTLDELSSASRLMFSHRLGEMAQLIPTSFTWDDLVLPAETLAAVQEVVRFAVQRPFLLDQWGFGRKLPYGRGVSAILVGPPGTGKTMVAQLLAREMGYELYRIDLSQVVNKYIGETEKNLSRIFDEAESAHAVLFFDEADSLFAKRTEVKSSNDRYANLEVNYLLQRMETFSGTTLLATNLEHGIDAAFKRRVRFTVAFELPELDERRRLWQSMFPPEMPLADIDWDLIATSFEMAGGYIKKAAVRAAVIAAAATPRRPLTTQDILTAARAEYREMGRIVAG